MSHIVRKCSIVNITYYKCSVGNITYYSQIFYSEYHIIYSDCYVYVYSLMRPHPCGCGRMDSTVRLTAALAAAAGTHSENVYALLYLLCKVSVC